MKTYPHELIGEEVEVIKALNTNCLGLRGKIVDESKATLRLQTAGKMRLLLKNHVVLRILKRGIVVEGRALLKKPEERIKG